MALRNDVRGPTATNIGARTQRKTQVNFAVDDEGFPLDRVMRLDPNQAYLVVQPGKEAPRGRVKPWEIRFPGGVNNKAKDPSMHPHIFDAPHDSPDYVDNVEPTSYVDFDPMMSRRAAARSMEPEVSLQFAQVNNRHNYIAERQKKLRYSPVSQGWRAHVAMANAMFMSGTHNPTRQQKLQASTAPIQVFRVVPLQELPASKNMRGGQRLKQPSIIVPGPSQPIQTSMPWQRVNQNVKATT